MAAAWPERIERVVLSGPLYVDAAGRAELRRWFKQWTVAADGSQLLDKWQKSASWLTRPRVARRIVVDLFRAGEDSEQGHFAVAEYRMEDRLPKVCCPALLLCCKKDPFASAERAAPLMAACRPAREATIDAGIFAANEAPAAYAGAVLDYVRGEPQARILARHRSGYRQVRTRCVAHVTEFVRNLGATSQPFFLPGRRASAHSGDAIQTRAKPPKGGDAKSPV